MPGYLAAATIVLLVGMVLTRVLLLRRAGTRAMHFGSKTRQIFSFRPSRCSTSTPSSPRRSIGRLLAAQGLFGPMPWPGWESDSVVVAYLSCWRA
jgi:hypothetical protein